MKHAFAVTDSFAITGRGVALVPGIPPERIKEFGSESAAELRRPDGSVLNIRFTIEHVIPFDPKRPSPILVSLPIEKGEVPKGTQVWIGQPDVSNQSKDPAA